jgi:hypothetical protein
MRIIFKRERRQGSNAHGSSILLVLRPWTGPSGSTYTEGLGWQVQPDDGVSVFFEPHDGSLVGFCATREPRRPGQHEP